MGKLDGRIAVITGGARGMGFGAAKVMGKHGAKLVLISKSENVFESVKSLKSSGYEACGYQADVRDMKKLKEIFKEVVDTYGKIDILVNAAGGGYMGDFTEENSEEVRDLTMDVNFNGTWNACRVAIPYMVDAKYGKIITFGSVTGPVVTDPGMAAYASSKGAIMAFTKALAMEFAHVNIHVNCILPGSIDTPLLEGMISHACPGMPVELVKQAMGANIPMRRLGTIEEAGEVVAFLASEESNYITGTCIVFDGGNTVPETPPVDWPVKYGGPETPINFQR